MKLSLEQIQKVAKLANFKLSPEELTSYTGQLSAILGYIDQLNQVDTASVEPTYNVTGRVSAMRPDEARPSLSQAQALANAAQTDKGFFSTKGVFSEE